MLSSLPNVIKGSEGNVTQTIENGVNSIKGIYAEGLEYIQQRIEKVSQELQNVEEKFVELDQKTGNLEKQVNEVQANLVIITQQNETQLNTLKESVEKIQATLDIVVNLTTPFWKKWSK
jgi:chromosome segregation ATPase